MTADALAHALHDHDDDLPLRPLPVQVLALLAAVGAPARLAAHLRAVHDVAVQLLDWLPQRYPDVPVDRAAVAFGAATHDIGKAIHRHELSGPGSAHEPEGYRLLLAHGVPERLARFARDHARWDRLDATMEDLLVSLADKIWKGRREPTLEQRIIAVIEATTGQPGWEVFLALDEVLEGIADRADARLAYQSRYPT